MITHVSKLWQLIKSLNTCNGILFESQRVFSNLQVKRTIGSQMLAVTACLIGSDCPHAHMLRHLESTGQN